MCQKYENEYECRASVEGHLRVFEGRVCADDEELAAEKFANLSSHLIPTGKARVIVKDIHSSTPARVFTVERRFQVVYDQG